MIKTKEGIVIHALKRYSSFAQLATRLRATLPVSVLFSLFSSLLSSSNENASGKPAALYPLAPAQVPACEATADVLGSAPTAPPTLALVRLATSGDWRLRGGEGMGYGPILKALKGTCVVCSLHMLCFAMLSVIQGAFSSFRL